ncbi:MAG: D-alanyl-D-alanine carboxypeptidase [Clostridia bacterium]|nr:D-alanyl-D-alanine carboxypeptidase [Clostridia bacterium]
MKKIISAVTVIILIAVSTVYSSASHLDISAQSAALLCAESGEFLYMKNADERLSMASTTKIMTSLLALEYAKPDEEIVVTKEMVSVEGTSMGLVAGDSVSLSELVYGMLLQSGNDAANTVATVVGGDAESFADMMNKRAAEIGMTATNFVTASGLDDEKHYSTARDMALLAAECLRNPEFVSICSQKTARLTYGNPPYSRTLTNHNRLLWSYPDAIGIKTGFTKKSGRCLVSAAKRGGVTLVAVTLNAPDDWSDHKTLLDYGFSVCKSGLLTCDLSQIKVGVFGSDKSSVGVRLGYESQGLSESECILLIRPYEYAPIEKGDILGKAVFVSGDGVVAEIPVEADESAEVKSVVPELVNDDKSFFKQFSEKLKEIFIQR